MAVHVVFMSPRPISTPNAPGIGIIRARETVAAPGVTNTTALAGEMVMVVNDTDAAVMAAYGSAPDADLTAQTNESSAGLPVLKGTASPPIMVSAGNKVSVKAS